MRVGRLLSQLGRLVFDERSRCRIGSLRLSLERSHEQSHQTLRSLRTRRYRLHHESQLDTTSQSSILHVAGTKLIRFAGISSRNWNESRERTDLGRREATHHPNDDRPQSSRRSARLERSDPHLRLPRSTNLSSRRSSSRTSRRQTPRSSTRSLWTQMERSGESTREWRE